MAGSIQNDRERRRRRRPSAREAQTWWRPDPFSRDFLVGGGAPKLVASFGPLLSANLRQGVCRLSCQDQLARVLAIGCERLDFKSYTSFVVAITFQQVFSNYQVNGWSVHDLKVHPLVHYDSRLNRQR